jgi:hypothetical protein
MNPKNPTRDFLQEVVFLPGVACQVYVGVADDQFRDRLQQAVITLMRARPKDLACGVSAKELADDLCVPPGVLESVLLALEQDDLVRSQDGLFTLTEAAATSGPLRDSIGWMFWNSLAMEFLPILLLDTTAQGLPRHPAPQLDLDAADQHRHQDKIPPGAMLEAARHPEFVIGRLTPGFSIETANQLQVRSISREGPRRGWPLAILAEIRPRFGGTPAVFLHHPRPLPDWPSEPTFAPFLHPAIKEQLPAKAAEIDRLARDVQSQFLRENHAEFLEKLGGAQKVLAEAEARVESELAGTKLAAQFSSTDLKTVARDAELNLILFQQDSALISEASVRRDFATVLQALGGIVSDISADYLQRPDVKERARNLSLDLHKLDSPNCYKEEDQPRRRDFWRQRFSQLEKHLGCDLRDWRSLIVKNLSALDKFLKDAAWESKRHTLGSAFTCWCAVPLIGESCPSAQDHLAWMKSAVSSMANLPNRYLVLKDVRNEDKVVKTALNAISLDDFRADVYALWRAFGREWR